MIDMCVDELMDILGEKAGDLNVFVDDEGRLRLVTSDGYEADIIEVPRLPEGFING